MTGSYKYINKYTKQNFCDHFHNALSNEVYFLKDNSCLVEDVCKAPGERNPKDACEVCDPNRDRFGWSRDGMSNISK